MRDRNVDRTWSPSSCMHVLLPCQPADAIQSAAPVFLQRHRGQPEVVMQCTSRPLCQPSSNAVLS